MCSACFKEIKQVININDNISPAMQKQNQNQPKRALFFYFSDL